MEREKFKFSIDLKVRNFEVDWQGIVHNAIYLQYFETARIEYLQHLGIRIAMDSIQNESKVVLVRNEVNYRNPVRYGNLLRIYTRISSIGNTSFVFEGMMFRTADELLMAENVAFHVWLDPSTDRPLRVPEHFRASVGRFEGDLLRIAPPGGGA